MAVSPEAQRNDELFPDHRSTLKVTDPDLLVKLATTPGREARQSLGVSRG